MNRRDFLITSAMTMGAAATPLGWQPPRAAGAKTDRIAIMVYSFVRVLKLPGRPSSPERTLDVFDVPEMFADRYKVHHVEMQHNYFESTEASYFKGFLARLAKTKSRVSNVNRARQHEHRRSRSRAAGSGGGPDQGMDRPRRAARGHPA